MRIPLPEFPPQPLAVGRQPGCSRDALRSVTSTPCCRHTSRSVDPTRHLLHGLVGAVGVAGMSPGHAVRRGRIGISPCGEHHRAERRQSGRRCLAGRRDRSVCSGGQRFRRRRRGRQDGDRARQAGRGHRVSRTVSTSARSRIVIVNHRAPDLPSGAGNRAKRMGSRRSRARICSKIDGLDARNITLAISGAAKPCAANGFTTMSAETSLSSCGAAAASRFDQQR